MGLRERQATQTRELLLDTALTLFLERGYDATTMEDVAATAEVGTSTLYRYFPTKDSLVIAPLALHGQMADALRARPADEPLDVALGHAVLAAVEGPTVDRARLSRIRAVIDAAPAVQAPLLEQFYEERERLEEALADRLGRPRDDLFCLMTARVAALLLELVAEPGQLADAARDLRSVTAALTERLAAEPPVLPRVD